jgi:hypothetical protein
LFYILLLLMIANALIFMASALPHPHALFPAHAHMICTDCSAYLLDAKATAASVQADDKTYTGTANFVLKLGTYKKEQVRVQAPLTCDWHEGASWTCSSLEVGSQTVKFTADDGQGELRFTSKLSRWVLLIFRHIGGTCLHKHMIA